MDHYRFSYLDKNKKSAINPINRDVNNVFNMLQHLR